MAYRKGAVTDQTYQKWFGKFCARDFSLDNAPQSDRPVEINRDQIETLIENNQLLYYMGDGRHTENLQVKHWKSFAQTWLCDVWVPCKLSKKKKLLDHTSTCDSLLKHNENVPILKQIVMGDVFCTKTWNRRDREEIMTEDFIELEKDKISDGKDMQIESNVNMKKKKKLFTLQWK